MKYKVFARLKWLIAIVTKNHYNFLQEKKDIPRVDML